MERTETKQGDENLSNHVSTGPNQHADDNQSSNVLEVSGGVNRVCAESPGERMTTVGSWKSCCREPPRNVGFTLQEPIREKRL